MLTSYHAIIIYSIIQMKKNLNRLIAEVEVIAGKKSRGGFKITSSNFNQYTNRILVDAEQHNQPSFAQQVVQEEMKDYREAQKQRMEKFKSSIKEKATKLPSLQEQIIKLERSLNILMMEDVMGALRMIHGKELFLVRPKLVKLQNHLSFKLEEEELQPHTKEPLETFLKELSEIINKANRIY